MAAGPCQPYFAASNSMQNMRKVKRIRFIYRRYGPTHPIRACQTNNVNTCILWRRAAAVVGVRALRGESTMFAYRQPLSVVGIVKIANERPLHAMSHVARNAARFSTPFSTRFATRFVTRFATFSTIFHNVCEGAVRTRQGVSGQRDTSPAAGAIQRSNGEIVE
jgi:hypothetical protein